MLIKKYFDGLDNIEYIMIYIALCKTKPIQAQT